MKLTFPNSTKLGQKNEQNQKKKQRTVTCKKNLQSWTQLQAKSDI